ncbi:hypothetical protein M8J75_010897 [Diaphorina citri]|nr:hypothetical protein M8J75_010897 [Diaphorina citri]
MSQKSKTPSAQGGHVFESSFENSPQPLATSSVNRAKQTQLLQHPVTKASKSKQTTTAARKDAAEISALQKKINEIKASNKNGPTKLNDQKQKDILEQLEEIQHSLDEKYRRLSNNVKSKAKPAKDLISNAQTSSEVFKRPSRVPSDAKPFGTNVPGSADLSHSSHLLVPGILDQYNAGHEKYKPRHSSSVSSLGIIDENSAEFSTVFQEVDPDDNFDHILQPKPVRSQISNSQDTIPMHQATNGKDIPMLQGTNNKRLTHLVELYKEPQDENVDPNLARLPSESSQRWNNMIPERDTSFGRQLDSNPTRRDEPWKDMGLDDGELAPRPSLAQSRLSMQRHLAQLCLNEKAQNSDGLLHSAPSRETFDIPTPQSRSSISIETFDIPTPQSRSSISIANEDSFSRLKAQQEQANISALSEEFNTSGSKFLAERADADYESWVRTHAPIPLLPNEMRDGSFSPRSSLGGASSFAPSEYFGCRSESIGNVEACLKSQKARSASPLGNMTITLNSSEDKTLRVHSDSSDASGDMREDVTRPSKVGGDTIGNNTRAIMQRYEDDRDSICTSVSSVMSTSQLARILEQHSDMESQSELFQEFLQEVSSKNSSKKSSQRSSPSKCSDPYSLSSPRSVAYESQTRDPQNIMNHRQNTGNARPNPVNARNIKENDPYDMGNQPRKNGNGHQNIEIDPHSLPSDPYNNGKDPRNSENDHYDPHSISAASEEFFLLHRPGSASSMRDTDSPHKLSFNSSVLSDTSAQGNGTVCLDSPNPAAPPPEQYIFYLTSPHPSSSPLTPLALPPPPLSRRSTAHTRYSSSVNSVLSDNIEDDNTEEIEVGAIDDESTEARRAREREELVRNFQRKLSSKLSDLSGLRPRSQSSLLNSTCGEGDLTIASLLQSSVQCDPRSEDERGVQELDVGYICIGTTLEISKLIINPCSYLIKCYAEVQEYDASAALVMFETERFDIGPGDQKTVKIYIVPLKTGSMTVQYLFRLVHTFTSEANKSILGQSNGPQSILGQSNGAQSTLGQSKSISYRSDRVRLCSEMPRIELVCPQLGAIQFGIRPARFSCSESLLLANRSRASVPLKFVLEAREGGDGQYRAKTALQAGSECQYDVHVNTPDVQSGNFLHLSGRLQVFLNISDRIASQLTEEVSLLLHNIHIAARIANTPILLSIPNHLVLQANCPQQISLKNVTNEPLNLKLWIPDDNREEFILDPNYIARSQLNKVYTVQCVFQPKTNSNVDRTLDLLVDYNPRSPKSHCFPIHITGVSTPHQHSASSHSQSGQSTLNLSQLGYNQTDSSSNSCQSGYNQANSSTNSFQSGYHPSTNLPQGGNGRAECPTNSSQPEYNRANFSTNSRQSSYNPYSSTNPSQPGLVNSNSSNSTNSCQGYNPSHSSTNSSQPGLVHTNSSKFSTNAQPVNSSSEANFSTNHSQPGLVHSNSSNSSTNPCQLSHSTPSPLPSLPPRSYTPCNLSPRLRASAPSPCLSVASADGSPLELDCTRAYIGWTAVSGHQMADPGGPTCVSFKLRNRNAHREKLSLALLNRNDCFKILKDKDPVTELKISMSPMECRDISVTFVPSPGTGPKCNAIVITRVNTELMDGEIPKRVVKLMDGEIPKRVIPLYGYLGRSKVEITGVQKDINQRQAPAFALLRSSNSRVLKIDSARELLLPANSDPVIVELSLALSEFNSAVTELLSRAPSDVIEIARVTLIYGEEIVSRVAPGCPSLIDYPYLSDLTNMFQGEVYCNTKKLRDSKDMLGPLYTKDITQVTIGIVMDKADIELILLDTTVVFEELNSTLYKTHFPSE